MPKVTYEVPSFGEWVMKTGLSTAEKYKVELNEKFVPACWSIYKGSELAAYLYDAKVEIFDKEIYQALYELAVKFEGLFVSGFHNDTIDILCHYPK